jgi:hypothetical protein
MLAIAALLAYCAAFARWRRATAGQKMLIVTDTGLRTHPLVMIANVTARDMTKFGAAFGVRPFIPRPVGRLNRPSPVPSLIFNS